MKTVKVKIAVDGTPTYKAEGYVGGECKQVQVIFAGLGPVTDVKDTADMHKSNEMPAYNELGYGRAN